MTGLGTKDAIGALIDALIEAAAEQGAQRGSVEATSGARRALAAAIFPSELERGAFLLKDAEFVEELAASLRAVRVRARSPSHQDREKQRMEQEMFRTRADRLTSIAQRIRRVLP